LIRRLCLFGVRQHARQGATAILRVLDLEVPGGRNAGSCLLVLKGVWTTGAEAWGPIRETDVRLSQPTQRIEPPACAGTERATRLVSSRGKRNQAQRHARRRSPTSHGLVGWRGGRIQTRKSRRITATQSSAGPCLVLPDPSNTIPVFRKKHQQRVGAHKTRGHWVQCTLRIWNPMGVWTNGFQEPRFSKFPMQNS
jgi:hypothetical protein